MLKCPICQSSRFRKTEETMHCDKCDYTNKNMERVLNENPKINRKKIVYSKTGNIKENFEMR